MAPDGSFLGAEAVDVHAACRRCLFFSSLSYSAGPVSSSSSAESLARIHGIEWYRYHLKTCRFQSALFLTNSQSTLALLSMAPVLSKQSPSGMFGTSSTLSFFPRSFKFPVNPRSLWTSL